MIIRELQSHEYDPWLALRQRLWPDLSRDDLKAEQDEIIRNPHCNRVFVAVANPGAFAGFVEVSIRDWAEGCRTRPVGYVEAWYVEPSHRKSGVGRLLINAAEQWAFDRGCTEMGSDAELDNQVSRLAHQSLGYVELGPVVLFCKKITRCSPGNDS